jgi:endonuclease YncB( thermonuclease family)
MTRTVIRTGSIVLLGTALPFSVHAADLVGGRRERSVAPVRLEPASASLKISGRAAVIDGRTLWFPKGARRVRLASIDTCELPQWSFDPRRHAESKIPKPVPCGPLAKAWLKRSIGNAKVACSVRVQGRESVLVGRCVVNGKDLAVEMLRVGWARAIWPAPANYAKWQNHAMSARHGMWATYVLDMQEWRTKAVDRALSRQPIADFNLLAERESEISPPFSDARKRPWRVDR